MPARRRLASGISSVANTASDVLGMLMQDKFSDARFQKQQGAEYSRGLLTNFTGQVDKLTDPAYVEKHGADTVSKQYAALKRRLPKELQGMAGEDPDFSILDSTPEDRMANLTKEVSGITNPDDPTLTPAGLKLRAPSFRVPTEERAPVMFGGLGGGSVSDMSFGENPDITALAKLAETQKQGLLAKEAKNAVPDFSSGTQQQSYVSNRNMPAGPVQAERTPGQEAERQGQVTTATQQATQRVINDPMNIKGFATREGAAAFARTAAQNTADAQTKVVPQVIEGTDPDTGNKVWKVIDASPRAVGSGGDTGISGEAMTDQMRTSYTYGSRAAEAHNLMTKLEPLLVQKGYLGTRAGFTADEINAPESISDPVVRQYAQAMRVFINSGLGRPESGGAISEQELKAYQKANAFTPGIDATTLGQVQDARREAIKGLAFRSGSRLKQQFVTTQELSQLPSAQGREMEDMIKEAEASGYRVIR